jgi:hypothetical protein
MTSRRSISSFSSMLALAHLSFGIPTCLVAGGWLNDFIKRAIYRIRAFVRLDLAGGVDEPPVLFRVVRLWVGFA